MAEKSNIAWTDSTVNFWSGCTKVSAGCANCYAEARDARMLQEKVIHWGKGAPRLKSKCATKDALAFNRKPWVCDNCGHATAVAEWAGSPGDECPKCFSKRGHRRRIFSLSLGDWLDDEVPIEWLAEMLDNIRQCHDVIWILCTKRPENFRYALAEARASLLTHHDPDVKNVPLFDWIGKWERGIAPHNVCLLTSVENQAMADERIPKFLAIPARWHGLSMEPLLGLVDLRGHITPRGFPAHISAKGMPSYKGGNGSPIDWIIIGGESGPNARYCNVDWIRSIVQQGKAAGVATFVKQLGAFPVTDEATPDGWPVGTELVSGCPDHRLVKIKDIKGGDPVEWPVDLRVQEYPVGF